MNGDLEGIEIESIIKNSVITCNFIFLVNSQERTYLNNDNVHNNK